jgi:DNA-binding transcriptional MerR regulator
VTTLGPRELAELAGVSTDTLRHYERKGLIARPHRTAAGYRRYAVETVERVQLIQRALAIGFSLTDLAAVLKERDRGGAPCRRVHQIVSARVEDLDKHLEQLTALRGELAAMLSDWEARLTGTAPGTPAHLLDTLAARPMVEQARKERRGRRGILP